MTAAVRGAAPAAQSRGRWAPQPDYANLVKGDPLGLICPISTRQVDQITVRLTALGVLLAALAAQALPALPIAALLVVDFLVRGFLPATWSPLATVARRLRAALPAPACPINAGPKVFAARLGFLMAAAAAACAYLGLALPARAILAGLALCAGLEAVAGVCLGCHIYTLLLRLTQRPRATAVTPLASPTPTAQPNGPAAASQSPC